MEYPEIYVVWTGLGPGESPRSRVEFSRSGIQLGEQFARVANEDTSTPAIMLPCIYPPDGFFNLKLALVSDSAWRRFWKEWPKAAETNLAKRIGLNGVKAIRAAQSIAEEHDMDAADTFVKRSLVLLTASISIFGESFGMFEEYGRIIAPGLPVARPIMGEVEYLDDEDDDDEPSLQVVQVQLPEGMTAQDLVKFLKNLKPRKEDLQ